MTNGGNTMKKATATKTLFPTQKPERAPLMVAYGVGVDSTAMLVGMHQRGIRPDAILFADVGAEKPSTYAFLPLMQAWLKKVGFPQVTVVKNPITHGQNGTYGTIEENVMVNGTLPSLAFGGRACSEKWKHTPQNKWTDKWAPAQKAWAAGLKVRKCIGYDAGPADARRPDIASDAKYTYEYPLREWGWDREECKRQIAAAGLPVPDKSACWFCPSTKPCELNEDMGCDLLRRIIAIEANAEPRQIEREEQGLRAIKGLWRVPTKGHRGATKKPGTMTEYIVGEELLPEFKGQTLVDPWWKKDGPQEPGNEGFRAKDVLDLVETSPSHTRDGNRFLPARTYERKENAPARTKQTAKTVKTGDLFASARG